MPIEKKSEGCYHVHNTTTKKCLSKDKAKKQLAAIEISKHMHENAQTLMYRGKIYEHVQNMPMPTDTEDDNVEGFFGRRGAGCLFLALNTGNVLIGKRSEKVMEPGTWGTWGGKIEEDEDPVEALQREIQEEAGFNKQANYIGVYVFKEGEFRYYNYLVTVPQEFQPTLNEETDDFEWTSIDNLPQPLHFGLEVALPYYKSAIRKVMNAKAQH